MVSGKELGYENSVPVWPAFPQARAALIFDNFAGNSNFKSAGTNSTSSTLPRLFCSGCWFSPPMATGRDAPPLAGSPPSSLHILWEAWLSRRLMCSVRITANEVISHRRRKEYGSLLRRIEEPITRRCSITSSLRLLLVHPQKLILKTRIHIQGCCKA